ncbi:hypothetical protein QQ020_27175 [Fulvivirgaceae bacterium BMA12]|uniref:Uncharacterized protein n=1 Tax=Agaribacillus aureus TaxID=3051825 RepID=A0ABT8LDD6_9BACT|nr:hypothetical protein [Fulvivirgaceae bacterium BMA12]
MTKTELLNVAIKIFGLYYFVRFVQHFMEFLFMAFGTNFYDDDQLQGWFIYAGIFLTFLVDFVFAYFAIFRTEYIVSKISRNNEGTLELQTTKTDLLEIALAIISIVAILNSIPDLLSQQVNSIYYHDHKEVEFWTTTMKNHLYQSLFMLAVGIFLLFNSRNFAKWIVNRGERDDKHDENSKR